MLVAVLMLLTVVLLMQGGMWCSWTRKDSVAPVSSDSDDQRAPAISIPRQQRGMLGSVDVKFHGYSLTLLALRNECVLLITDESSCK